MSNSVLKEHLSKIETQCVAATSKSHIEELIAEIIEYSQSGSYSVKQPITKLIMGICLFILVITFFEPNRWGGDSFIPVVICAGGVLILSLLVFFGRKGKIRHTTDEVFYKATAIHNGLQQKYDFDGREMWSSLKNEFPFFNKGDEDQRISRLYEGLANDGTVFSLFEFEYVEVREEEEEDSDGNKTTKETRTTYHDQGCIVEFSTFTGITINSNRYRDKWDSASKSFNKKFKVRCLNSVEAAKFFTPSAVLMFEDEFNILESLDVLENSKACIGVVKSVLPTNVKTQSIKNTDEFLEYLRTPQTLPSLESTKKLIAYINERTTNNFKKVS